MDTRPSETSDPRYHAANIKRMLEEVRTHAREDVQKVEDPRARVLFEVTAEVLQGLITAHTHYEEGIEAAWRR